MIRVFVCITLLCLPVPALAHKVIMSVFPSGTAIEGELGLSNGTMASNTTIVISDSSGATLGQTQTDADGFFIYTPKAAISHTFFANLGAGHVGHVEMTAQDVAQIMGVAPTIPAPVANQSASAAPADMSNDMRQEMAAMIRDELRPLRREIAASREHANLQSILGGIGYIMGLFGLGFYIAARRKLGE